MTIDNFIKNFAELFDETDITLLNSETEYKKLEEWSSMMALSVIAMIDAEYNVQISGADIRSCKTVKDLFEKVNSLKGK